jgi:hypothetical protein
MESLWDMSQAHAIIAEITKSTGTNSMGQLPLEGTTRMTPNDMNATKPKVAKESTQLSMGSLYEAVTTTFVISM